MKKVLFGTTALLAAGAFAPTAQASDPIELSVNGYMKSWVAIADQDNDALSVNSVDVQQNSEIHFNGQTVLDNGMKVRVHYELEMNGNATNGGGNDEIYVDVSGKYGAVRMGSDDNAADLMMVMAPTVSPLSAPGDGPDFEAFVLPEVNFIEVGDDNTGDDTKITYFTPKMYGFQLGASYTPGGNSTNTSADPITRKNSGYDDAWAFGLTYDNTFSGVGVDAAVTYQNLSVNRFHGVTTVVGGTSVSSSTAYPNVGDDNEVENIGAGLNLSYMGFTFGGGYMRKLAGADTYLAEDDGYAWNLGLAYEEGPYGVSLGYAHSSVQGDQAQDGNDDLDQYQLAGVYKLGAGVDLFAEVDYSNGEADSGLEADGNEGAVGGAVGLSLSF